MSKVKHRHSKARGRLRRTHYKVDEPAVTKCQQCGKMKLQHKVCPYCGYYKDRQVKKIETIEERKAKRDGKERKT